MTDKPIIFSGPMVRATLEGRKTQDRRVLSRLVRFGPVTEFQPSDTPGYDWTFRDREKRWHDLRDAELREALPFAPGDRLWVKETWKGVGSVDPPWVLYKASGYEAECKRHGFDKPYPPESELRWTPSIYMPRWASRITLIVEDVRVQRVQEISRPDCLAEGMTFPDGMKWGSCEKTAFIALWNTLNQKRGFGWEANPWVCAVTFRPVIANIDAMENK